MRYSLPSQAQTASQIQISSAIATIPSAPRSPAPGFRPIFLAHLPHASVLPAGCGLHPCIKPPTPASSSDPSPPTQPRPPPCPSTRASPPPASRSRGLAARGSAAAVGSSAPPGGPGPDRASPVPGRRSGPPPCPPSSGSSAGWQPKVRALVFVCRLVWGSCALVTHGAGRSE